MVLTETLFISDFYRVEMIVRTNQFLASRATRAATVTFWCESNSSDGRFPALRWKVLGQFGR